MTWLLHLDYTVFTWINGLAGRNSLLDTAMRTFCNDHLVPFTLGFMVIILALHGKNRQEDRKNIEAVIKVFISIAVATLVMQVILTFVHRPRPFVDHPVNLLFYHPTDWSFPSNPATATFTFFFSVWFSDHKFGWWFLPPAVLMSFARVFCGVHYPGDVLAGIVIAAGSAYFVHRAEFLSRPFVMLANGLESRVRSALSLRE
jgi:undecaprenyl-diphosphatase